jgi:endonuclease/exonuclease/phosphatase family metal-dependent hydrolase
VLIRSWNLFHGNACPPRRRSYLEEMVQLVTADGPDVVLFQEVPAWALSRLGGWSGMTAVTDVAQRPRLGPLPIPRELGRMLTALAPGLLRSAFAGQGNAILVGFELRPTAHEVLTLNPPGVRRQVTRELGLDPIARLAWAKERRVCQIVRLERPNSSPVVVANLHATSSPGDRRIPGAEIECAASRIDSFARESDVIVFGGDFNIEPGSSALPAGYSEAGPAIDHLLVRNATASSLRVWPAERRCLDGILLSDHAPVELEIP